MIWLDRWFPRKYLVRHQKVRFGEVRRIDHGPYRLLFIAYLVSGWICGSYDRVDICVRR